MATQQRNAERTFPTHIDIPQEARTRLVRMLNDHLADVSDLRSQTKQAHWNVKGKDFFQLHELFDEIAEELDGFADELAERATALDTSARMHTRFALQTLLLQCMEDQKLSIMALSRPSPTVPNEGSKPAERIFSPNTQDVNWAP